MRAACVRSVSMANLKASGLGTFAAKPVGAEHDDIADDRHRRWASAGGFRGIGDGRERADGDPLLV